MAGMRWHPEPTDDVWKQAHLAMVEGLGKRLWLSCDQCEHWVMIEVRDFAEQHGLDMLTPLLTISRALKCSHCGERRELVPAGAAWVWHAAVGLRLCLHLCQDLIHRVLHFERVFLVDQIHLCRVVILPGERSW
jgi:hypothetical protein